jgi:hypothetical protein
VVWISRVSHDQGWVVGILGHYPSPFLGHFLGKGNFFWRVNIFSVSFFLCDHDQSGHQQWNRVWVIGIFIIFVFSRAVWVPQRILFGEVRLKIPPHEPQKCPGPASR